MAFRKTRDRGCRNACAFVDLDWKNKGVISLPPYPPRVSNATFPQGDIFRSLITYIPPPVQSGELPNRVLPGSVELLRNVRAVAFVFDSGMRYVVAPYHLGSLPRDLPSLRRLGSLGYLPRSLDLKSFSRPDSSLFSAPSHWLRVR